MIAIQKSEAIKVVINLEKYNNQIIFYYFWQSISTPSRSSDFYDNENFDFHYLFIDEPSKIS
jgi:hypothetical protein